MRRGASRSGRIVETTIAVSAVAFLLVFAVSALAASMPSPGTANVTVLNDDVLISPPLVFLASDDFSGCNGQIDGWVDSVGNAWTSRSGNWQCLGGGVVRAQQRVSLANLTVDIAQSSGIRISTYVSDISHQNNRSGPGLSLLGAGADFIYVIYERDQAHLTVFSTATGLIGEVTGLADRETATMSAVIAGNSLTVQLDGQTFGPFDLTGSPHLGNTRFGLISDNDNQSRFDTFTIELLP